MKSIQALRVLNTRPAPQGLELNQMLQELGFSVEHWCPIEIKPIPQLDQNTAAKALALNLDQFSDIIVTSVHGAQHGLDFLANFWPQWPLMDWWAIGDATAKVMSSFNIKALTPTDANSESVLQGLHERWSTQNQKPPSFDLDRKKVLVVRGKNGRGLIEAQLNSRNIAVESLECYERLAKKYDFTPSPQDAVIITSTEIADHLLPNRVNLQLFGQNCFYVCASERITDHVRSKGATEVVNSRSASNKILSVTLERLLC